MAGKKSPLPPPAGAPPRPRPKDLALQWRIPFNKETEPGKIEVALRERIKELNCLYGIVKLAERHRGSVADLLAELVDFLPRSWQFPELACARVTFQGVVHKSRGFKATRWRMAAPIAVFRAPAGEVEIFYTQACPPSDEGPFLNEERALIDAVAEQIGAITERVAAETEVQEINRRLLVEQKALQETNAALKTVLARIEEEKKEIYRDLKANVEKILLPILYALALELPPAQRQYVDVLRTSLEEIASPFISQLARACQGLTPTEIAICNMIRHGSRTKEIARFRGVSEATINRHRENIRRKLNLTNEQVNLTTFLQANLWESKA